MMESFFGHVQTTLDAAILMQAAMTPGGGVSPIQRRLSLYERERIRSGSVFVFTESETGMRRWTDGMRWSKSRVDGQFLVYRRLDQQPSDRQTGGSNASDGFTSIPSYGGGGDETDGNECSQSSSSTPRQGNGAFDASKRSIGAEPGYQSSVEYNSITGSQEGNETGDLSKDDDGNAAGGPSLKIGPVRRLRMSDSSNAHPYPKKRVPSNSYYDNVMCKKTFSINIRGFVTHVICYYCKTDLDQYLLPIPSKMPQFARFKVSAEFLDPSNFRLHKTVPSSTNSGSQSGGSTPPLPSMSDLGRQQQLSESQLLNRPRVQSHYYDEPHVPVAKRISPSPSDSMGGMGYYGPPLSGHQPSNGDYPPFPKKVIVKYGQYSFEGVHLPNHFDLFRAVSRMEPRGG